MLSRLLDACSNAGGTWPLWAVLIPSESGVLRFKVVITGHNLLCKFLLGRVRWSRWVRSELAVELVVEMHLSARHASNL